MSLHESLGLVRVGCAVPELRLGDVAHNVRATMEMLEDAAERGCRLVLFPELGLTGYSCGDLFNQALLLDHARQALQELAAATARLRITAVVGLPLGVGGRLFNCAAFLSGGRVLGVVPKTHLPTRGEFYEARWFTSARMQCAGEVAIGGERVPFGTDLLFTASDMDGCVVGIEVCEDLWAVQPPSGALAEAGATVLVNPSASNELLGKVGYRRDLVRQQSARCQAAYLYTSAGPWESSTDVVYSGHALITEHGSLLAESERFSFESQLVMADLDIERLLHERVRSSVFSGAGPAPVMREIAFELGTVEATGGGPLLRRVDRMSFVPQDPAERDRHCEEIFAIQCTGLARRLRHIGTSKLVIGLSGGLDSTLALLVAVRAFDKIGLDRAGIVCLTMPGFGTTRRTRGNAHVLAESVGATMREIPITAAVLQHFADIGHDRDVHDVTYENAQARERTQIIMDVANQVGGIALGTGDLSELALGWCTFNGDHMSMYHVNAGVPKTLVRFIVDWCAEREFGGAAADVLRDISATPISPELLPLRADESLQQETESIVGPYLLHDFFLFHAVRHGSRPRKIFRLATHAFAGEFAPADIAHWMGVFYRRFFSQQFKRSAMPDGPKVGSVALSPRGDWRMPSDATATLWLAEVETLVAGLPAAPAAASPRALTVPSS